MVPGGPRPVNALARSPVPDTIARSAAPSRPAARPRPAVRLPENKDASARLTWETCRTKARQATRFDDAHFSTTSKGERNEHPRKVAAGVSPQFGVRPGRRLGRRQLRRASSRPQSYVQQAAQSGQPAKFAFFTPEQAAEVEAMAAQIIPTDDTPGAREARVVHFIDRALVDLRARSPAGLHAGAEGSRGADEAARSRAPTKFSALTSEQQIQVLTAMEKTPFFNLVRTHTITGFFASPVHGGNANKVGWKLVELRRLAQLTSRRSATTTRFPQSRR